MAYEGGSLEPLFTPELAEEACHDMADDGGWWLFDKIVEFTPVYEEFGGGGGRWASVNRERGRAPGTLKRSWRRVPHIRKIPSPRGDMYESRTETRDPIAPYVENDTRAHIIRPKHAKMLRFRIWPSGAVVYARMVRHPGTTGAHMVLKAETMARAEFAHICAERARLWAIQQARHALRANR